jgi:hypothetical protein
MPSPDETLPPSVSSTNGSAVLEDQLLLEQAEAFLDLKVADYARLMADNQRVLNQTLAADQAHTDQQRRFGETIMGVSTPASSAATPPQDDMVINIRSPVTHNHPAPPAPVAQPAPVVVQPAPVVPAPVVAAPAKSGMGTLGKLVTGAAILAGGGGLGALATYALSRPSTTEIVVPPTTNTTTNVTKGIGYTIKFPE